MSFQYAVEYDRAWLNLVPAEWEISMKELSYILGMTTAKARKFASKMPSFKRSNTGHFYLVSVGDVREALKKSC